MGHQPMRLTILALALVACSTSDRFATPLTDAGIDDRTEPDASFGTPNDDGARFGGACDSTRDCAASLFCDSEIEAEIVVDGLPAGRSTLRPATPCPTSP